MLAVKYGLKGVTIYRDAADSSRYSALISLRATRRETPRGRKGLTERVQIGCGNLYITVNSDEQGIVEVFTNTGKGGGCPSQSEATSRLVSVSLRSGVDINTVIEQLKGIRCASTVRNNSLKVTSCPDAIARVIEKVNYINRDKAEEKDKSNACPECGTILEHDGGCVTCRNCGYSKCG